MFTPSFRSVLGLSLLLSISTLPAAVKLPAIFSDHMVVQAGKPVNIWGKADPGEKVTVQFLGKTYDTSAADDGKWTLQIDAAEKGGPTELKVNDTVIKDVLVGEVWLASGQSNMQFTVAKSKDAAAEMASATNSQIREFYVPHVSADENQDDVVGKWVVCSPQTVGPFSAVAYFFARDISEKLGTPVGVIHSSWGGSPAEGWMSPETLAAPEFQPVRERWADLLAAYPKKKEIYDVAYPAWQQAVKEKVTPLPKRPATPIGPESQHKLSGPYKGMIKPLLPYTIQGVLWYQGEANVARGETYSALFNALIKQWRADFGQGDFPFYFVQLANLGAPNSPSLNMAFLREAQATALAQPKTGMAVATDVGEEKDIHPTNKQSVGQRLALIALANTYGQDGEYSGPVFAEATPDGATLRVKFTHADGLVLKPATPGKKSFELAGADKVLHPAEAKVEGDTVILSSPKVSAPLTMRYAYAANPDMILYNAADLPAPAFRTDKEPVLKPAAGVAGAASSAETGE